MTAVLKADGGELHFYSDYDPVLVTNLKRAIPTQGRVWDRSLKCWRIDPAYGHIVIQVCNSMGIGVQQPLGATPPTPQNVTRLFKVDYIGVPKERDDGSVTSYGYADGRWSVILPESVLKDWFLVDRDLDRPAAAVTLYGVLGINRLATAEDIKSAFRRLAKQWHPDVSREPDAADMFRQINSAYETLRDPTTRRKYDVGLALEASLGTPRPDPLAATAIAAALVYDWRPPLRCGLLLLEGYELLGRFVAGRIIQWEDIVNSFGKTMTTSWPAGADIFEVNWV